MTAMQMSLLDSDGPAPQFYPDTLGSGAGPLRGYGLFFAIAAEPKSFEDPARQLLRDHGLDRDGMAISADRWHISLHEIAEFPDTIAQAVVDAAIAAASRVSCPPLRLTFDHALSFQHNHAFVLRCDPASDAAIARLRKLLKAELVRHGIRPKSSDTPHITLAYDHDRLIPRHPVPPIHWTATHFALILSHVGRTHHQRIAQWALTG